jgi:hypothetical protein
VWSIWWNENWQGKPKKKLAPSAIFLNINTTRHELELNQGRRGGNAAANRLSYGTISL